MLAGVAVEALHNVNQTRYSPRAMQPQPSLTDLIADVANRRDREAFALLFDHFAPRLKSYFFKLGVSDQAAEDFVQEVMLTVWRKAELFDSAQAGVSTWIFTIARNKRIDAIRRERRPEIDPEDPAIKGDEDPAPDDVVHASQMGDRVRSAVAELPAAQAELVRMSYFEDKSHTVIAEELGLPLGTVKSRIRLAVQRLRGLVGETI